MEQLCKPYHTHPTDTQQIRVSCSPNILQQWLSLTHSLTNGACHSSGYHSLSLSLSPTAHHSSSYHSLSLTVSPNGVRHSSDYRSLSQGARYSSGYRSLSLTSLQRAPATAAAIAHSHSQSLQSEPATAVAIAHSHSQSLQREPATAAGYHSLSLSVSPKGAHHSSSYQ